MALVSPDDWALAGGQVAAQTLITAGRTVEEGRVRHSLHRHFMHPGDGERPTGVRVDRDRDGRSFSARRVVATQGGEVPCSTVCPVAATGLGGPDLEVTTAPSIDRPETRPPMALGRLFVMDCRV